MPQRGIIGRLLNKRAIVAQRVGQQLPSHWLHAGHFGEPIGHPHTKLIDHITGIVKILLGPVETCLRIAAARARVRPCSRISITSPTVEITLTKTTPAAATATSG